MPRLIPPTTLGQVLIKVFRNEWMFGEFLSQIGLNESKSTVSKVALDVLGTNVVHCWFVKTLKQGFMCWNLVFL